MLDGDSWKYGDAPALNVIRKHKVGKSRLIMRLPAYSVPLEGYITDVSPNGLYCLVNCGQCLCGWVEIEAMRILDVLPPRQVRANDLQH